MCQYRACRDYPRNLSTMANSIPNPWQSIHGNREENTVTVHGHPLACPTPSKFYVKLDSLRPTLGRPDLLSCSSHATSISSLVSPLTSLLISPSQSVGGACATGSCTMTVRGLPSENRKGDLKRKGARGTYAAATGSPTLSIFVLWTTPASFTSISSLQNFENSKLSPFPLRI